MSGASLDPEWPTPEDIAALSAAGWRPAPIRQFVLKVHSRCNLACDYCYVYRMADQTWRDRPRTMSRNTVWLAADRIAEHARRHRLSRVIVIFHGGEPLLAGAAFFAEAAQLLRSALPPSTALRMTVQSNGVLLTDSFLDTLAGHDISVAVSLDGSADAHDRYRRYPNGRPSHADIARRLTRLSSGRYRRLFSGLLCTVDINQDPVECYEALLRFGPPRMDFLLPLGNWTAPPPGRTRDATFTPYADWLGTVFDRWYSAPVQETELRLFNEIIHMLLGGAGHLESLGLAPPGVAVIETDGSLEESDTLKSAYHGAAATGMRLATHSMDELLSHPRVAARQLGAAALATQCLACPVQRVCGGGFYPHRYRAGAGFRNPSVYCPDLLALIRHIRTRLRRDLSRLAGTAR
jgi:uncharacterized protein